MKEINWTKWGVIITGIVGILGIGVTYLTSNNKDTPNSTPVTTTTTNNFAPQVMTGSSPGTQIQAGEINLDTDASYTWTNKNTWYTEPSKNTPGKFVTNLQFNAGNGKLPTQMCADITTDVLLVEVFTPGTFSYSDKVGKFCVSPAHREHIVELTTETKPSKIDVQFLDPW